jgi:hypothetical protein
MAHNPLLDEIYAIREKLLDDAGGDIRKFLAGVRQREAASGRLLKAPSQRFAPGASAATPEDLAGERQSATSSDRDQ